MSKIRKARIRVVLERIRSGLATSEDAAELEALLDGRIQQIEVGLPTGSQEEKDR